MSRRSARSVPSAAAVAPAVTLFSTLAHPLRLRLLLALLRRGEMSAGELQDAVNGVQSSVSHQLATLREHRLVAAERHGRQMIYRLVDQHVAHIVEDALAHASELG